MGRSWRNNYVVLVWSNLPTGQEGSQASMVPRLRGLVCVPLEVVTIVAEPDSLAVTPYQRVLVVSLLVISPKEV